jgi:WD40 repeat protein
VRAGANLSDYSAIAAINLAFPPPSRLTVLSTTEQQVSLQWMENNNFESGYEIQMSRNNGIFVFVMNVPANATSTIIQGFYHVDTAYSFRLRAISPANKSDFSDTASTQLSFPSPTNLNILAMTDSTVTIQWQDNNPFKTGFEIERNTNSGIFTKVLTVGSIVHSASVSGIYQITALYGFRVRIISNFNASAYSDAAFTQMIFPPPSELKITSLSRTSIRLDWRNNSQYTTQFSVERRIDNGAFTEIGRTNVTDSTFADQGLNGSSVYNYRVRAHSLYNASAYSNEAGAQLTITGASVLTSFDHSGYVYSMAFSPDGNFVVSGCSDYYIKIFDLTTNQLVRTLTGHTRAVNSVAISSDGQTIVSGSGDRTVRRWSFATGTQINSFNGHSDEVRAVAFSPDGQHAASGSADSTIRIWKISDGSSTILKGTYECVNTLAYNVDGSLLASGGSDKNVRLWLTSDGKLDRTLTGHSSFVMSVVFGSSGTKVLSGSLDTKLKLWDIATGNLLRTYSDNTVVINAVALSPDGRYVASGDGDGLLPGKVRVRMTADGSLAQTIGTDGSKISCIAFSPNGLLLASGGDDRKIYIRQLDFRWVQL